MSDEPEFGVQDAIALVLAFLLVLSVMLGVTLRAGAQAPKNPCTAIVFKHTTDSLYAELQAPRATTLCLRVELTP